MNFEELKQKCLEDKIPIIRDSMIPFFDSLLHERNIKSILEIGTAYGYSAWAMLNLKRDLEITTIEKNVDNYKIAKSCLPKEIVLINADAFEYVPTKKYDLIFLDGPKNKQHILFDKYIDYLNNDGIIVIDNVYLNDVKNKTPNKSRIHLLKSNDEFVKQMLENDKYNKELIDIADGVMIIWKKD